MYKLLMIFILFFGLKLFAYEPILAILHSINGNGAQSFSFKQTHFTCRPYGVDTLEKLYLTSAENSECRDELKNFYKMNPELKYFSYSQLKVMQMYHLEFIEDGCILYAKGQKSLSELLLREGLAYIKPDFENDEFGAVFKKAQESAIINKRGVWQDNIVKVCTIQTYKE